jgi:uncharacterized repeat protein (TIGR02543 family)
MMKEKMKTGLEPDGRVWPLVEGRGKADCPPPGVIKAFLVCLCFAGALFAAGCKATGVATGDDFDDAPPLLKGFPLSAHNAVLFKDRGTLTIRAQLSSRLAAMANISWELSEGDGLVTIEAANDGTVTLTPEAEGQALLTAKLTPKEGYTFDEKSKLISECRVTVLDALTIKPVDTALHPSKLLFFEGEQDPRLVMIDLDAAALEELKRVANIAWTVEDGAAASAAPQSAGVEAAVSAQSAGTATLRAALSAKNADESGIAPDFNGGGISAILELDTHAVPALSISDPGPVMLDVGDTPKTVNITLTYPAALFAYDPTVSWTPANGTKADLAGGVVASGAVNAVLTAKAAGPEALNAAFTIEGRTFTASLTVTVVDYVAPTYPVEKITLSGVSGSPIQIVQTDSSAVITAAAGRTSDANPPTNKKINWSASPDGFVSIDLEPNSNPDHAKVKIKALSPTSTNVTITAASDSNPGVTETFTVKVEALTITITPDPASFTYNAGVTLSAAVNAAEAANRLVTWSAVDLNAGLAVITGTTIKTNAPVTAATNLTIRASSTAATTVSATRTVTVNPHSFNIAYIGNGSTDGSMATQNSVTYGSTETTLTKNVFTRTDHTFQGWTLASNGSGTVLSDEAAISSLNDCGDAKNPGGSITLYAKWKKDLGVIAAGEENNPDLMIKFGIKPEGYTSSSAEDVTETFLSVQAYIHKPAVSASGSDQNAMLGYIALGDYVKLPSLVVASYPSGGGALNVSNTVAAVVGISPYKGINDNGNDEHLAFLFKDVLVKRRMNSSHTNNGGYAATEMRKYLTAVDGDANSGKFLAGLITAGVPNSVFWNPRRVIGNPAGVSASELQDLVFLPTIWEISGGTKYTQAGSSSNIAGGEGSANQGRFTAYRSGTAGNTDRKKTFNNAADYYCLASSATYSSSTTHFTCIFPDGTTGYYTAATTRGITPAFCVK